MSLFAQYLKETDLFYNLNPAQLATIEQICQERMCQPGEIIFHENSRESELYLIVSGRVDILVDPCLVSTDPCNQTEPEVIERFWPGQSFGEMALVDEGVRSGSAVAVEENTHLLIIPRQELLALCEAHPEIGYRVMFNLALDLSHKIRNAGLKIRESILQNQGGEQNPG